ncbi:Helicase associated domain protein [Pseudomonas sp. CBMAI 2609]|uniref:Helicase associated domain protein n=1 Tax=Pseudomonas flavocrustae TaxID=2991719 RepID=A0ABT6IIZ6_9PSED|nr:DEAD/DEAH box helicase [Pseudomonas sp. CBMAI 2609]MDH4764097.1 Helicase associated domain protein [Pseudomonas sp. CBMAI 2609]
MQFSSSLLAPHQLEARARILDGFKRRARLQVHMACGTGKTRLAQGVAAALGARSIVIFLPSLALVSQTLQAWVSNAKLDLERVLRVCSDESVATLDDEHEVLEDLPVAVTTSPEEIALKVDTLGRDLIVLCTYASAPTLAQGLPAGFAFDLGIFDEAHKTAGAAGRRNSFALNDHPTLHIDRRLFLTATPLAIAEEEGPAGAGPTYSMTDEAVFGPVAYELSYSAAVAAGIICDFRVIISVEEADDEQLAEALDDEERRYAVHAQELLRAMADVGARKAFAFYSRISQSKRFATALREAVVEGEGEFWARHIDGSFPSWQRTRLLHQYGRAPRAALSCARCLAEGVDVPDTDLVTFMHRRESHVDIVQALGRAVRKAPGKRYGYVLIPLRLKRSSGESLIQAVARSDMSTVWRTLAALAEQDDAMLNEVHRAAVDQGETGRAASPGWFNKLHVIAPAGLPDARHWAASLKAVLSTELVGRIAGSWPHYYGLLRAFVADRGHARVARSYRTPGGHTLGAWCSRQRALHRLGRLAPNRAEQLEAVGFEFDPREHAWERGYGALRSYLAETGSPSPAADVVTVDGVALGHWCSEQRKAYRLGRLAPRKKALLEALGFTLNPFDDAWEKRYQALVAFKEAQGHLRVAQRQVLVDGTDLADWCRNQRSRQIDLSRRDRLAALGFDFDVGVLDARWEAAYAALKDFCAQHGHVNVPLDYVLPDGTALGTWVGNQRARYRDGQMDQQRIELLNQPGFVWEVFGAAFDHGLQHLEQFKAEHGHCDVPIAYVSPDGYKLGRWCSNQRTRLKSRAGDYDHLRLVALGFSFDPAEDAWRAYFSEVMAYIDRNRSTSLPAKYVTDSGMKIGAWVSRQRTLARTNKLSLEKREKLFALGLLD